MKPDLFLTQQDNFVEVVKNQEFLLLSADDLGRLLLSDDINVPSEETIFDSLVTWASHDLDRSQSLAKLLSHIRLPLLSPQVVFRLSR